jgi:ABC-2 type transport system permease protein
MSACVSSSAANPARTISVAGSAVYLAVLALFSLAVGAIVRHTAGAITAVLSLVLGPVIAIGFLPEHVAEPVEKVTLMPAGLAIQQTVERDDNIPLSPWAGLGVISAYAAVALLIALVSIARRDA